MSAPRYNLIKDFASDDSEGHFSMNPHWIVAVVRLDWPATFDRYSMSSVKVTALDVVDQRGENLIITSDCVQLQVAGSKSTHLKTMQAQLLQGDTNYMAEILPGDWCACWMMNDEVTFNSVVERLRNGQACNEFSDGIKFIGRIQSIRKSLVTNRGSGRKTVRFNIQAVGFKELDTTVFYEPDLQQALPQAGNGMNSWLGKLSTSVNALMELVGDDSRQKGALSINKAVPFFVDLLLGTGIPKEFSNPTQITKPLGNPAGAPNSPLGVADPRMQIETGLNPNDEAPFAYTVPKSIGNILGRDSRNQSKSGGVLAYADIVELLHGVQRYSNGGKDNPLIFTPDGVDQLDPPTRKYTRKALAGLFQPDIPNFTNKTIWSILYQWLNPTINEMYTCMRVNNFGKVVPTIVLRQIPFTTPVLVKKQEHQLHINDATNRIPSVAARNDDELLHINKINSALASGIPPVKIPQVTPYMEIPRWVMDPAMVWQADIGRSDANRINFVHVYGKSPIGNDPSTSLTSQLIRSPPIRDDLDIQRSGIHSYMALVNCSVAEAQSSPRGWMEIISDFVMGQQLSLNGTINCAGIQSPICEGDNLEWDGIVFHIDEIAHSCSMDVDSGNRTFVTSMNLGYGLSVENESDEGAENSVIYPNMTWGGEIKRGFSPYDPSVSYDAQTSQQTAIGSANQLQFPPSLDQTDQQESDFLDRIPSDIPGQDKPGLNESFPKRGRTK